MQHIAMENSLSETAFTVKEGDHWHLRWFTPGGEIDLIAYQASKRSGELYCHIEKGRIALAGYAALYAESDLKMLTQILFAC